jgi:hypothetical protein
MVKWKLARRLQCISVMLANITSKISTLCTVAGKLLATPVTRRRLSDSEVLACIVAELETRAAREEARQAALDACPAMVDATRAYLRMELRNRACEGDAFALSALRMMAA